MLYSLMCVSFVLQLYSSCAVTLQTPLQGVSTVDASSTQRHELEQDWKTQLGQHAPG